MDDTTARQVSSALIAEDLRSVIALLVRRTRANPAFPPHQFGVLRSIDRTGPQTASQLAAVELVRPQTMAHTLRQLDVAGFITREPDPTDGRQTLIALSDAGRTALAAQRQEVAGWLARAIEENLDAGERDALAAATNLLSRLVDASD